MRLLQRPVRAAWGLRDESGTGQHLVVCEDEVDGGDAAGGDCAGGHGIQQCLSADIGAAEAFDDFVLQAGGGAGAVGGESGGGSGGESCLQKLQGCKANGVGLCGGGQIEQLCQQKVLLWARCQQSDGGGALFRGECVIQSCVAGVVSDVLDEGQCIGLILPCDGETAATAAESLIDGGEQFCEVL